MLGFCRDAMLRVSRQTSRRTFAPNCYFKLLTDFLGVACGPRHPLILRKALTAKAGIRFCH